MKKVEEMCAKLGNASGTPINQSDVLLLGINGTKSKLPLSEFVKGYSQSSDEIRGFSILLTRQTELVDNRIKFNNDILISLFRESNDEEIVITKIFPHWFQGSDKEVDIDLQEQIIREEYQRLTNEIVAEVEEEIHVDTGEVKPDEPTEDGYKSNTHKAICVLASEAIELQESPDRQAQFSTDLNSNQIANIKASILSGGKVFEMESSEERFKAIKQKAKDAAKYLGASEPVVFEYTKEVSEFLYELLGTVSTS